MTENEIFFKGEKNHFITIKISDWTQLAIKRMPSFKTKMFYLQFLMDYQLIQWRHPNIQNDHKSSGQVHSFWGNIFIVKYLPQVSLVERLSCCDNNSIQIHKIASLVKHRKNKTEIMMFAEILTSPIAHIYLPTVIS